MSITCRECENFNKSCKSNECFYCSSLTEKIKILNLQISDNFKRAAPKVLRSGQEYYELQDNCNHRTHLRITKAFEDGDKNGQNREWLRPDQFVFREAVKTVINNHFGWDIDPISKSKLQALENAFKNLKPPYENE